MKTFKALVTLSLLAFTSCSNGLSDRQVSNLKLALSNVFDLGRTMEAAFSENGKPNTLLGLLSTARAQGQCSFRSKQVPAGLQLEQTSSVDGDNCPVKAHLNVTLTAKDPAVRNYDYKADMAYEAISTDATNVHDIQSAIATFYFNYDEKSAAGNGIDIKVTTEKMSGSFVSRQYGAVKFVITGFTEYTFPNGWYGASSDFKSTETKLTMVFSDFTADVVFKNSADGSIDATLNGAAIPRKDLLELVKPLEKLYVGTGFPRPH